MGRSFLYDLHVRGRLDADRWRASAPRPAGDRVREVVGEFEALARDFPPPEVERQGWVPEEARRRMGRLGLFGMSIPAAYGGMGLPFADYLEAVAGMAAVDVSLALVSLAHLSIGVQGIVLFGTEEQRARLLPPAATGETVYAYALTEPATGSDARHIRSTARPAPDGTHYVLDGRKTYITNANYAGAFTVFAQIEGHRPGYMGAFVVERDREGVWVGKDLPKMGLKASSTAPVHLDGVRVPAANRLGAEGEGFRVAMGVLNYGRLAVCAAGVGLMRRSVADMTRRAAGRVQFGQPIDRFELIQEKIARARMDASVAEAMVGFAARELEEDPTANAALETSHCKLFTTTRAWSVLYDALQVAGGSGYLATAPYERRLRDWRVSTIFEGTTEIHSVYPALQILRGVGEALPRGTAARALALVRGCLRGAPWPLRFDDPQLREAVREARRCGRWVRILSRLALLAFGEGVARRQFLLRRVTWLSLREFALLASAARIDAHRRAGREVEGDRIALALFAAETREERRRLRRLGASRREKLLRRLGGGDRAGGR